MPTPIGIQLYTVREQLASGYEGTIRQLAAWGCEVFETAGFPGSTPEEAKALFAELGVPAKAMHVPPPVGENRDNVIATASLLGCKHLITTHGPDRFKDDDAIRATCEEANEAVANCREHGMSFGFHNHWWEFDQRGDRRVFDIMLEQLDADVFFEIDIYWVHAAGLDPAQVIQQLGPRAKFLHVKDGPAVQGEPMTALGEGVVNLEASLAAATHAEAFFIELDQCATDMMEAVRKSFEWMKSYRQAHTES